MDNTEVRLQGIEERLERIEKKLDALADQINYINKSTNPWS